MNLAPEKIEQIISGRNKSLAAHLIRFGLWALTPAYRAGMRFRNTAFDWGWRRSNQVSRPVISIGNLTVGGTGKTPIVAWLAEALAKSGIETAIVSRGYGSSVDVPNDEYLELKMRLPQVPHVQNSNRTQAVQQVISDENPDVILLDDGFQHRKLKRNLDVVLVDCTNPFGFGHLLPRGFLREPIQSIQRAHAVILTRSDQVEPAQIQRIMSRLNRAAGKKLDQLTFAEVRFAPSHVLMNDNEHKSTQEISVAPILAFCGIGNPQGFERLLERELGNPQEFIRFPDHHAFSSSDISNIVAKAKQLEVKFVVCTLKDFVKAQPLWQTEIPLGALVIDAQFARGESAILERVTKSISDFSSKPN